MSLAMAMISVLPSFAQLVATKDLVAMPESQATTQSEPKVVTNTTADSKEADCVVGIRDGVIVREEPEHLRLEIIQADPRLVYAGATILVTLRLTNDGDQPVSVPWETGRVEPEEVPDRNETSYEWANIHLKLGTLKDRQQANYLKGEANLFAAPTKQEQHKELRPGQWVEVKFQSAIECHSNEKGACHPFEADNNAQLTADWWESLSTHESEGCNAWRGYYKSRTIESSPVQIVYVATPLEEDPPVQKP